MKNQGKTDVILWMIFVGIWVCVGGLFAIESYMPHDDRLYMFVIGLGGSFTGAFFQRIDPKRPAVAAEELPKNG